jgi:CheY-like chemotaxis protein
MDAISIHENTGQNSSKEVWVLLVEDDPDLLEELADGLSLEGHDALTATSAEEGLALLQKTPSLEYVVTDLMMPGMGGMEFLKKMALLKPGRRLVSVVITGGATIENAVAALRYGVTDFLQKPVTAVEIATALQRYEVAPAADIRTESPSRDEMLTALMRSGKECARIFGEEIRFDPVWDLLLDLALSAERGEAVSTTGLCNGAGLPTTTGLRRLDELEANGLIERYPDQVDRRRVMVRLSRLGEERMHAFLDRFTARFMLQRKN